MCTAHRYFRFKSCAPAGGSGFEWWERLLFTRLEFYGKLLSNQLAQWSEWWVGTAATDTRSRTIALTYLQVRCSATLSRRTRSSARSVHVSSTRRDAHVSRGVTSTCHDAHARGAGAPDNRHTPTENGELTAPQAVCKLCGWCRALQRAPASSLMRVMFLIADDFPPGATTLYCY